jgi:molybdopterin/thiamine biosynthesis adenylyltransferase
MFVLFDHNKVVPADLGTNFFVRPEAIGADRAGEVAANLVDLNSDVKVSVETRNPLDVIEHDLEKLGSFDMVLTSGLPESHLRRLAAFLYERGIPFLNVDLHGFIACMRLAVPEHTGASLSCGLI